MGLTFSRSFKILLAAIAFAIAIPSYSQNTKGDKPASNQRSILRIPRLKSKKKGGDKAYTKDISGRRIRTKNKSSAVHAIQNKPLPYARKRPSEVSRVGKPIGGHQVRFKSSTAKAARNNLYPSDGYYVNNPSPKPHDNQNVYSNGRVGSSAGIFGTKREPPGRGGRRIRPRSASSSYVTRGRKNVYWGKFRKGERPITTDLTGRSLRAKNFHSPGLGVIPSSDVYRKRKRYGDRPYKGTFISGFATSGKKNERGWSGDVSGHAIRMRPPRVSQSPGNSYYSNYLSNSASGRGGSKPIPGRYHGKGINALGKFFQHFRGVRTSKGGGSVSRGFNNNGRPIDVKSPGVGAQFVGGYRGFLRSNNKTFSQEGLSFSGNVKSGRPLKGGGSISGRGFNNGGRPVDVRTPGIGANMGNFSGNIRGQGKAFSQVGLSYSGNIKTGRPLKGGGSMSGRGFNNGGQPISVRPPGIGANMGDFRGNLKSRRPLKGGGSISGSWNNGNRSIDVRAPGIGANMGDFRGNLKSRRPLKGGGSISGSWNNGNRSIDVTPPAAGAKFIGQYQGFMRRQYAAKGGGSISGRVWNNSNRPVDVRAPGIGAKYIGGYQGFVKQYEISPGFGYQGETFKGFIKARRPEKGGGSISGRIWNNGGNAINRRSYSPASLKVSVFAGSLKAKRPEKGGGSISDRVWNNNQKPILTKAPALASANEMGYSGRIKLPFFRKKYVRNPKADKEALKKIRPDKSIYEVAGLQIKVRQKDYGHNRLSAKGALNGETPGKNSAKASEFDGRMKMLWSYKHNPNSNDKALKSIRPTKYFDRGNEYAGAFKMKRYVHSPSSNKNALKVFAPNKAVARIRDYQGNLKMNKPNGKNLRPDAQFAHGFRNNVKQDRTFLMNIKLRWAKLFKKNANQPEAVKEKIRRPRYDKKERELWKALYD